MNGRDIAHYSPHTPPPASAIISQCSFAILAGGENRRMPLLKSFISVGGRTIIRRNLDRMRSLFREIFIVTNEPEHYFHLGIPLFGDIIHTRSPMTGIVTALLNASQPWVFVAACDMPFIHEPLIRHMALLRKGVDAVIPRHDDREEPLFAYYSGRLLEPMVDALGEGKKGMRHFLRQRRKRVRYVTKREIKTLDPELRSFINLNTPADIDLYLSSHDGLQFRKAVKRRKRCSGLAQQN